MTRRAGAAPFGLRRGGEQGPGADGAAPTDLASAGASDASSSSSAAATARCMARAGSELLLQEAAVQVRWVRPRPAASARQLQI